MKPMTNPPTVKNAPMIVKIRTRMAPVRTLDLIEEFIITAPTTMIMPLMIPIAPAAATATPTPPSPLKLTRDPRIADAAAKTRPVRR